MSATEATRARPSWWRRRRTREAGLAALFLAPSVVVFGAFFFYPIGRIVYLGFFQQNQTRTRQRWVGTEQYVEVLTGDEFREGLSITVRYVLYTVPAGLVLGVLLAVAANRRLRGIKIFHTIFASTVATSVAVASIVWLVLINPTVGYLEVDWLRDPDRALFGVALSSIWQNLGLTFIIVLAGLQAIPEEINEAATVDGMSPTRRFFTVTLPMLSPTLLFLVVVLTVFAFQAFAQIDILTNGGPAGSTETLVFKIFQQQQGGAVGEGSVMAVGLFVITFLVALGQFLLLERRVHYGSDRA
ncbi:sugar ABC transporter permease [Acidimicrobiia bacterium EGI L10123]|uniref:carbohydrate ABC transporter permease n=1 Tax=Salinilacustrithrix flava TaxID=2957203 RepID=UPI003D7C1EF3|nr:sugar ABC transporter permease [Acidimicrobiia bacterium EGI L10123]